MERYDIILFRGTDWISKIIQYATGSEYSHVGFVYDKNFLIEARSWYGVQSRDIKSIAVDVDVYRVKDIYTYVGSEVINYLVEKIGSRYDYGAVLYLGLLKLWGRKEEANKWGRERDLYCSELIYEAFKSGGLDIVPDVPYSDMTTPSDIANSIVTEKV